MNSESSLRQATKDDRAKLKEIIDLSFPRFFRFFASHSVDSEDGIVLVNENQGTISGFAKLIEFNIDQRKFGCILWIAVHPLCRHRGIGSRLTKAGVNCLRKSGSQAVFASTQRRNRSALLTLGSASFERINFLGLLRFFGWRVFEFYGDIWFAPGEIVLIHE